MAHVPLHHHGKSKALTGLFFVSEERHKLLNLLPLAMRMAGPREAVSYGGQAWLIGLLRK